MTEKSEIRKSVDQVMMMVHCRTDWATGTMAIYIIWEKTRSRVSKNIETDFEKPSFGEREGALWDNKPAMIGDQIYEFRNQG